VLAALQDLSSRSLGKVEYKNFWVANMIWVRAGSDVVQALAQRADVAHIYANPASVWSSLYRHQKSTIWMSPKGSSGISSK